MIEQQIIRYNKGQTLESALNDASGRGFFVRQILDCGFSWAFLVEPLDSPSL